MVRILVAFDGSEPAVAALEHVFDVFPDADITVLYVIDPTTQPTKLLSYRKTREWLIESNDIAHEVTVKAHELSDDHGVPVTVEIEYGSTASKLLGYCKQHEIEQVVAGSHSGPTTATRVFGSVAEQLVRRCSVPITIVRRPAKRTISTPPESVLVPYDESEPATAALTYACERFPDATITVVHYRDPVPEAIDVLDTSDWDDERAEEWEPHLEMESETIEEWKETDLERSEAMLEHARAQASAYDIDLRTVSLSGYPQSEIADYVRAHGIEHVCIGNHGRTRIERFLLGSVAEATIKQCSVPVTVLRAQSNES